MCGARDQVVLVDGKCEPGVTPVGMWKSPSHCSTKVYTILVQDMLDAFERRLECSNS